MRIGPSCRCRDQHGIEIPGGTGSAAGAATLLAQIRHGNPLSRRAIRCALSTGLINVEVIDPADASCGDCTAPCRRHDESGLDGRMSGTARGPESTSSARAARASGRQQGRAAPLDGTWVMPGEDRGEPARCAAPSPREHPAGHQPLRLGSPPGLEAAVALDLGWAYFRAKSRTATSSARRGPSTRSGSRSIGETR